MTNKRTKAAEGDHPTDDKARLQKQLKEILKLWGEVSCSDTIQGEWMFRELVRTIRGEVITLSRCLEERDRR